MLPVQLQQLCVRVGQRVLARRTWVNVGQGCVVEVQDGAVGGTWAVLSTKMKRLPQGTAHSSTPVCTKQQRGQTKSVHTLFVS